MAPSKEPQSKKKEKLFHPQSRKAGQLERKQLRVAKLQDAAAKKVYKDHNIVDRHAFFFHALPPEAEALSLAQVHDVVRMWLTRNDEEIEQEGTVRRKGRPPSTKELKLTQLREFEVEEYRTGMEVLDLTHPANAALLRRWHQDDGAFLQILRYIRISSEAPHEMVVSKVGKHQNLLPSP